LIVSGCDSTTTRSSSDPPRCESPSRRTFGTENLFTDSSGLVGVQGYRPDAGLPVPSTGIQKLLWVFHAPPNTTLGLTAAQHGKRLSWVAVDDTGNVVSESPHLSAKTMPTTVVADQGFSDKPSLLRVGKPGAVVVTVKLGGSRSNYCIRFA
jgi:hypothetical protein